MRNSSHRAQLRRILNWGLGTGVLIASCFSSHKAVGIPLTLDAPDTRSYGPQESGELTIRDVGIDSNSQVQSQSPKTDESSPFKLSLTRYRVPAETTLLSEVGLSASDEIGNAVEQAMSWVSQSMSASARAQFAQRCEEQLPLFNKSMQLTSRALACVPWAIEKLNATHQIKSESKNSTRTSANSVRLRSESDWKVHLRGVSFLDAFWRIDPQNMNELQTESAIAASTGNDCQYRGAFAALIARAESFYPDPAALSAIEKIYPLAFRCLEPDDDGFERTHLRVGLLRLMMGELRRAKQSLLLSAHAENPDEEFRSLFWLGVIEEKELRRQSRAQTTNEFWELLRKRYPLSIHSVVSSHSLGIDPLSEAISSKDALVARRIGSTWSEFNLAAFFFELLSARKQSEHLASFARFSARIVDAPHPDALLFLSKCYSMAQAHKVAIGSLTRYFKETQSQGLTLETMNLFFPRVYTDQILNSAGVVDPVIVLSLIRQESAFDPLARSGADARGLMQLLPSTASKWLANSKQELYDPSQNVRVGVKYMETLFKRYDGNVEHVLAAYNAGLKNLDRWRQRFPNTNTLMFMDLIPFKETRTYVAIILRNAYWYGRLMALQRDPAGSILVKKSIQAKWRSVTVQNLLRLAWAQENNEENSRAALAQLYTLPALTER